jgi:hypothetical protein
MTRRRRSIDVLMLALALNLVTLGAIPSANAGLRWVPYHPQTPAWSGRSPTHRHKTAISAWRACNRF